MTTSNGVSELANRERREALELLAGNVRCRDPSRAWHPKDKYCGSCELELLRVELAAMKTKVHRKKLSTPDPFPMPQRKTWRKHDRQPGSRGR